MRPCCSLWFTSCCVDSSASPEAPSHSQSKDVEILVLRHQLKVLLHGESRDPYPVAAGAGARKRTYRRKRVGGRPPLDPNTRELILRLGRENRTWGCMRIPGRRRRLTDKVNHRSIRNADSLVDNLKEWRCQARHHEKRR